MKTKRALFFGLLSGFVVGMTWDLCSYAASLECVSNGKHYCKLFRMKVPHGWLVTTSKAFNAGITFYPDEKHEWDVTK